MEEASCGGFGPSSFLFVGSPREKALVCAMHLSRVVNHCQQLLSCRSTVLLDAPCNSGLQSIAPLLLMPVFITTLIFVRFKELFDHIFALTV